MAQPITVDDAIASYANGDYLLCQLQLMACICQQLERIANNGTPPTNP